MGGPVIAALKSERGTTLIETTVATGMLLVAMAGLLGMAALATTYTENHGHLEARTAEYAQDKMEQLLSLTYGDHVGDTVPFPATATGGCGLASAADVVAGCTGGSADTDTPVNKYVDWLTADGSLLGGGAAQPTTWFYERVWQVTNPAAGLKQITVTATVRTSVGRAIIPRSTVVALKSKQF